MTTEEIEGRLHRIERSLKKVERKGWLELAVVPLAIAVTGYLTSKAITQSQIESAENVARSQLGSAEKLATAQIESAKEKSASEQTLKSLELHMQFINDKDPNVRRQAVDLLSVIEPELANKLRGIVLARTTDPVAKAAANEVEIAGWFPVVSSIRDLPTAQARARAINGAGPPYVAQVYGATDTEGKNVYAVTLGGYLAEAEANARVRYAKAKLSVKDAYSWRSSQWGQNLLRDNLPH